MVEQSGLDLTAAEAADDRGRAGLALGAVGGLRPPEPIVAAVAGAVGGGLPLLYVQMKRKARLEKLLSQLPDAFDLMCRVIRAGQTMSQALLAVADEFPPPIAAEFSYCYEQQNLGLPPEVAYATWPAAPAWWRSRSSSWPCSSSSRPAATSPSCSTSSRRSPRAVPDPGPDQDADGRGPDAGDRPAGPAAGDVPAHAGHEPELRRRSCSNTPS